MTTWVIGCGVTLAIASTSPFVAAGLPWPSATSTPADVTTNMLVVVNFSSPAWKSSYVYTLSVTLIVRGKSVSLRPRLIGSAVRTTACAAPIAAAAHTSALVARRRADLTRLLAAGGVARSSRRFDRPIGGERLRQS